MHDEQQHEEQKGEIQRQLQLLDKICTAMMHAQPCAHLVEEWFTRYPERPLEEREQHILVTYVCDWARNHQLTEAKEENMDVQIIGADCSWAFLLLHVPDRVEALALIVMNEPAVHLHALTATGWHEWIQRRTTARAARGQQRS